MFLCVSTAHSGVDGKDHSQNVSQIYYYKCQRQIGFICSAQKGSIRNDESALLFYQKLVADLISIDFKINPYDPCFAKKIINGKQLTICWHVDDLFLGHEDSTVVSNFLQWLSSCYNTTNKKLNNVCGPRHD
jgi:hypothetical protein